MEMSSDVSAWLREALDSDLQFNPIALKSRQWCVVPVESGSHFNDADIKNIAHACRVAGQDAVNALLVENVKEVRPLARFDATSEGLTKFNETCAHFNYALVPDDCSFTILCTTNDYYLLAGDRMFVEAALGQSIEKARAAFDLFAADENWTEKQQSLFQNLSARYRD